MCNFNKQNEETKNLVHQFMTKSAQSIGGANFLISLVEALRALKPHPLTTSKCQVHTENAVIKWNKVVFKDKLTVLEDILHTLRTSEDTEFNILKSANEKKKKTIINMVKTLAPVEFVVSTKNPEDGEGFSFKVFEKIEDDYVKINPVFVALFFCSIEYTKKALKY